MTHYSRAEWGGRPPRARYKLDPLEVRGIALHWPAMTGKLETVEQVAAALRSWQRLHMDTDQIADGGASDIAYQIAVDQSGNTYGLRGLRYRSAANGDTGVNRAYGAFLLIVAIGEQPSSAMVKTVRARVTAHRNLFPNSRLIVGHRAIRPHPTECPGDRITRLIADEAFGNPTERH